MNQYDVIVIGAGIAGMTSAIYLKRFGYNVLLLEKESPGGQLNKISRIENYPGFTTIDGVTLAFNIYEQIKKLQINYKYGNVIEIKIDDQEKIIKTDKELYKCKAIVLATGRIPNKLNLENEEKLTGKGISYCATCDGSFFKDEDVCIVGGGNSAILESIFLSNICKSVTIIYRGNELKAEEKLLNKMKQTENIRVIYNSVITTLNQNNGILNSIEIKTNQDKKIIKTKGLFVYIGSSPNVSYLKELGINLNNNYIVVNNEMETNIDGIYACGDAIKKSTYQLSTAVGEATIAANSAKRYLSK